MIRAITEASGLEGVADKVSRQKSDALFELAVRIGAIGELARSSETAVAKAAAVERRKSVKTGLELVAEGADETAIDRAFAASAAKVGDDPGSALEWTLVGAGMRSLASGEHYSVAVRRMTAFLGTAYFDKAEAWLLEKAKRRKGKVESLVVPGELPDVIRILAMNKRNLERVLRSSGRDITAAALAGCPEESMDLVRPLYGRIGAAALEDEAARLRVSLSGDEISQAQTAFLEVLRNLEERGELRLGPEEELSADPSFVSTITKAIISIDAAVLRGAFRNTDGALIATAMQGMEPEAHDHILAALPKKEIKRILDAIDDADPMPRSAVQGAGKALASKLFEAAAGAKGSKSVLEKLAAVRDWAEG